MKAKQELRALKNLYDLLPEADIACVKGCTHCCGPVPTTKQELRKLPLLVNAASQLEYLCSLQNAYECNSCPYVLANGGGCAVYDDRPFMCRLFGLVEDIPPLSCLYGLRTTKPLSSVQAIQLIDRYNAIAYADSESRETRLRMSAAHHLFNTRKEENE